MTATDQTSPAVALPADLPTPGQDLPGPGFADRAAARFDATTGRLQHFAHTRLGAVVLAWRVLAAVWRGTARARARWWSWVRAAEVDADVRKAEGAEGIRAHQYRKGERRARIAISIAVALGAGVLALVAVMLAGALVVGLPALLASGGAAARAGRREGERLTGQARKPGRVNQDKITVALRDAGVIKQGANVHFVHPVAKDGDSWETTVDLPPGVLASAALTKAEQVASALAVDEARLALSRVRGDGGHAGRLHMWSCDRDPWAGKPASWPLLGAERWSSWADDTTPAVLPFATTARGQVIPIRTVWTSVLIGALPRIGKSAAARVPIAAALLDPYVTADLIDGKGGGDWDDMVDAGVVERHVIGSDGPEVEEMAELIQTLVSEMRDRYRRFRRLPRTMRPEPKLTRALAENPELDMGLRLVIVDEIQEYMGKGPHRDAIVRGLSSLIKVGPAIGYSVIAMTQKPDDLSLPREVRDIFATRFALRCSNRDMSDMILGRGTGAPDASRLRPTDLGVGFPWGTGDDAAVESAGEAARTFFISGPQFRELCDRGRVLREAAGTLSGASAPEISQEQPSLLHLVRGAFGDADRLTSADLCERLKVIGLEMDPTTLAERLDPYGVGPTDIRTPNGTRRGYRLDDVMAAIGP